MPDIKQDLLGLQYSENFQILGMEEANIDLELPPASATSATVYGTVTDGTDPIADATVKLFDKSGMPYKHTLTDETGAFSISGIPAGTYSLGAVKDGYRLSDAAGVTLSENATTQINLLCTADATLSLGAIAGILTAVDLEDVSKPLAGLQKSPCATAPTSRLPPPIQPMTANLLSMMLRMGCIPCCLLPKATARYRP